MVGDELQFIQWLRDRQAPRAAVKLGLGDDMAALETPAGTCLVSADMLLDGVHFDTKRHDLSRVGRKALACGLSDCAAMAVRPVAAFVSLALPDDFSLEAAKELYGGLMALADEYDVAVVGGDTNRWDAPLAIDVTVLATPFNGIDPVRRSGAKPGDALFVTGPLGGSILGRHLDFTPRVHEAKSLAESLGPNLHAMIDISDGLSLDLWRMCEASHVAALLWEEDLRAMTSDAAAQLAKDDGSPVLNHVLGDGEDFELLLAVACEAAVGQRDSRSPVSLFPIGEVLEEGAAPIFDTGGHRVSMRRLDGTAGPVRPTGYIH